MIPSPGRIVQYTLSAQDAAKINQAREVTECEEGNRVAAGETYPMVIVRCWGTTEESSVNGQVLLDGNDTCWATSVSQGDGERHWREFPRV